MGSQHVVDFHQECAMMQRVCHHPNVVSFVGACNVLPNMYALGDDEEEEEEEEEDV